MSKSVISQEGMQKALSWAWDKSLNGIPGTGTAEELAESYLAENGSVENAIDELITWQCRKCGTSGFMTGLGGLVTLPVAIPANITSTLYMQLRMIAAIAYMCHEDVHSDKVQTLAYLYSGPPVKTTILNFLRAPWHSNPMKMLEACQVWGYLILLTLLEISQGGFP